MSTKFWLSVICLSASLAVAFASRHDLVGEVYSHEHEFSHTWGAWGAWEFCPLGQYVWSASVKWEPDSGSKDDTSTNGIRFWCGYPGSRLEDAYPITSLVGKHGNWESRHGDCNGPWFTGFQVAVQPFQGMGADDTVVNSVRFYCERFPYHMHYHRHVTFPTTPWGIWEDVVRCPQGSIICGLRTRVEDEHPTDAGGLLRLGVACCSYP